MLVIIYLGSSYFTCIRDSWKWHHEKGTSWPYKRQIGEWKVNDVPGRSQRPPPPILPSNKQRPLRTFRVSGYYLHGVKSVTLLAAFMYLVVLYSYGCLYVFTILTHAYDTSAQKLTASILNFNFVLLICTYIYVCIFTCLKEELRFFSIEFVCS